MSKVKALSAISLDDLLLRSSVRLCEASRNLDAGDLDAVIAKLAKPGARPLKRTGPGKVYTAAIIRSHQRTPSFLVKDTLVETRYSVVVLVAVKRLLAIASAGAGRWSDTLLGNGAAKLDPEMIIGLLSDNAKFQRVRMRSMSMATSAIRSRTIEADELDSVIPPQGLNRQIAESVTARQGTRVVSGTPTTGRYSVAGARIDIDTFVAWVKVEEKRLAGLRKSRPTTLFFDRFAQPIDMSMLAKANVFPSGVLLSFESLVEDLESGEVVLEKREGGAWQAVPDSLSALRRLSHPFEATKDASGYALESQTTKLRLDANKQSFRVSGSELRYRIRDTRDGEERTLAAAIQEDGLLFVTFNDLEYAYAFGQLFRDRGVASHGDTIRRILNPVANMASFTSEKGTPTGAAFEPESLFHLIENELSLPKDEPVLICDDMGDEWADFIGVGTHGTEAVVSLYHAKHHDDAGTSASALHDVIGQALKNLGRIAVAEAELRSQKRGKWAKKWMSKVERVRRGGLVDDAIALYAAASLAPVSRARICLVVSSLSKSDVEDVLVKAATGHKLRPHQTQLLHLLVAFVSLTREARAEPVVYCSP